jgi:GH15 family glucan-1,4-alpha-glucosidase
MSSAVPSGTETRGDAAYPPIADYGLIGDCHSAALVSRQGSIDWCCMPRLDADSCFGRLLDWQRGGACILAPTAAESDASRRYLDDTLVLETTWSNATGEVRVLDLFTMREGGRDAPHAQLVRIVEATRGEMEMGIEIAPRFDYGTTRPWMRDHGGGVFTAIGGHAGLLMTTDWTLETEPFALRGRARLRRGDRRRLSIEFARPHTLYPADPDGVASAEIDRRVEESIAWWRRWARSARPATAMRPRVLRSAIVIKALTNAPTGAIAAAASMSLPEVIGGSRNWDYRYSWVRDSSFALRSMLALGFAKEAMGFRTFIERTVAGDAGELQVLYGLGGEHRLPEATLAPLAGYRDSRPVRVGNAAHDQHQNDIFGELLDVAWLASRDDDEVPDPYYWRVLAEVVETARRVWQEPDQGIWEVRAEPRHFVHSKVMCWAALDRGMRLAARWHCSDEQTLDGWRQTREAVRTAIETDGYEQRRGVFVRAFGSRDLDAALLLIPRTGFVAYDDPRMIRTVDAIRDELGEDGWLLRRYSSSDGLAGDEGVFLACTFWLCECLARQGRRDEARACFDRAEGLASDLGLFAEQYDPRTGELLGNFPQGLSHYSHISAALAVDDRAAGGASVPRRPPLRHSS